MLCSLSRRRQSGRSLKGEGPLSPVAPSAPFWAARYAPCSLPRKVPPVRRNGKVFLLYPDGKAKLLDLDASEIWSGDLLYRGAAPTDIKLHNNALWATYAQHNVLVKFNLNTMRAEIRLGNKKGPFNSPKDIFIEGDCAFISNSGSNKLIQVNLNTYDVLDYESFEEPVYQYLCVDDNKIVILESGLYLI